MTPPSPGATRADRGAGRGESQDLTARNAPAINGARVTSGRLALNDTITFGKVVFRLVSNQSPAPVLQRPAIGRAGAGRCPDRATAHGERRPAAGNHQPGRGRVSGASSRRGQAPGRPGKALKLQLLLEVLPEALLRVDLDGSSAPSSTPLREVMSVDRVTIVAPRRGDDEAGPPSPGAGSATLQPVQVRAPIGQWSGRNGVAVVSRDAPADARFPRQSIVQQSVGAPCAPRLMASGGPG